MKIKFSGTGFTPIPNTLIDLWPVLLRQRYTHKDSLGREIEDRWLPIDRVILEVLFRRTHGGARAYGMTQVAIAATAGLKQRQLRYRLTFLERIGAIGISRNPGRKSGNEVDLDRLIAHLDTFRSPRLVEKPPDPSTTPAMGCRGTPAVECRGPEGGNGDDPLVNQEVEEIGLDAQQTRSKKEPCRNNPAPVDNSTPGASFSPPAEDEKARLNDMSPPEALLLGLALSPEIPEKIQDTRKKLLASGIGTDRQKVETLIRFELRGIGVKTSIINRWFSEIPADGMLFYLNQAYKKAREPAAWIFSVMEKTRGAYRGREGEAG